MSVVFALVSPKERLAGDRDRTAYEMAALAAAHFSRYGFAYAELPKLRDTFLEVLDRV